MLGGQRLADFVQNWARNFLAPPLTTTTTSQQTVDQIKNALMINAIVCECCRCSVRNESKENILS